MDLEQKKYPIGRFQKPVEFDEGKIKGWITVIKEFPEKVKELTQNMSDEQLDTPYRENGWTVRQVVHHCADSHINSFTRFKLALTEDKPVIKPYMENLWAELEDTKHLAIDSSLSILEGLHHRWTVLLESMTTEDYHRIFVHPEHNNEITLYTALATYYWHCNHHLGHIQLTLQK